MKDKEVLDRLLGRNKEEQERKIKERLEKRKQRLAEGTFNEIFIITARKGTCRKVMFLQLSVRCIPAGTWARRGVHPPTPHLLYTPYTTPSYTTPVMATESGGTHPTGMHPCFFFQTSVKENVNISEFAVESSKH